MNIDDARNGNMVKLAYFQQESKLQAKQIESVITHATDLIDAQTIVDTMVAVIDELKFHQAAAIRARDQFRRREQMELVR